MSGRSAGDSIVGRTPALVALVALVTLAACGGAPAVRAPVARPRPTGAVLLALPGTAQPFAVGASDVIRGRTRWHVDADGGATRAGDVLAESVTHAVAIPAGLGGGVALLTEHGVAHATAHGVVRPIARADLTALAIGNKELWARERGTLDWVRVDLDKARAARVAPPIAAPMLSAWSTLGAPVGKPVTTGPEFAGSFALAIVDLLGPVLSRDGGDTWIPLDASAVAAAFPTTAPNRIVRDGASLMLASDDRAVLVSTSGALGSAVPPPKTAAFAEVASIRVEATAPFGVALPGDELLVSDGARFATVQLDPVRVLRTWRVPDLGRCDLVASPRHGELAVAVCVRHQQSLGGQVLVGPITDTGAAPALVADKTFAYGTAHRISPSGALVVAATCAGTNEGGIDLLSATKVCVRDDRGQWSDVAISSVAGRRHVLARADGGVVVVRDDIGGSAELLALPRGAGPASQPLRLRLEYKLRDVIAVDEASRGRLVVWRRGTTDLRAAIYQVSDSSLRLVEELPRTILDGSAMVGTYGERALVAVSYPSEKNAPPRVEASITSDGGRTWGTSAWPEAALPLDTTPPGRRVECGALGCRTLGWARIGWHPTVTSADRVVSLASAETMPEVAKAPPRASTIAARCTTTAPAQNVTLTAVPTSPPAYPPQSSDVLLGLPPPKVAKDQTQVLTRLGRTPNVRGGLVTVGPTNGAWGDNARSVVRFATDLDALGVVLESAPFASPFPDRMSAQFYYGARATALAPGRVLVVLCAASRCDAMRVTAAAAPERIDLGNIVMNDFVNAREMGGSLAIFGTGTRRDVATPTKLVEPLPFVALIGPQGTTTAFFARADTSHSVVTIDPVRGAFGLLSLQTVPTWTDGAAYALPLGLDARPTGGFEPLAAPSPELTRPTKPCGGSITGWDEADIRQTRTLSLSIDGAASTSFQALAGAVRTRIATSSACLERITAIGRSASFQYDASTQRAMYYSIASDGKAGKKTELSCTISWE